MCKSSEELLLDKFTKKVVNTLILVSSKSKVMQEIVEKKQFETGIITTRSDLQPPKSQVGQS